MKGETEMLNEKLLDLAGDLSQEAIVQLELSPTKIVPLIKAVYIAFLDAIEEEKEAPKKEDKRKGWPSGVSQKEFFQWKATQPEHDETSPHEYKAMRDSNTLPKVQRDKNGKFVSTTELVKSR